jgi:Spy/CpxP family protein refolding chaperone
MKTLLSLSFLFVAGAFAPVFAQNNGQNNGALQSQTRPARPARALDIATDPLTALSLSAEQSQQLQTLQKAHQQDVAPLNEKAMKLRQDLGTEMQKPEPDNAKADAIMAETDQVMTQVAQKRDALRTSVRQLLTPAQQTTFDQLVPPAVIKAQPAR